MAHFSGVTPVFFTKKQHTTTIVSTDNGGQLVDIYCYSDYFYGSNAVNFELSRLLYNDKPTTLNPVFTAGISENTLKVRINTSHRHPPGMM
jgi:hypothetical protein